MLPDEGTAWANAMRTESTRYVGEKCVAKCGLSLKKLGRADGARLRECGEVVKFRGEGLVLRGQGPALPLSSWVI